jgi:hypothetical protein
MGFELFATLPPSTSEDLPGRVFDVLATSNAWRVIRATPDEVTYAFADDRDPNWQETIYLSFEEGTVSLCFYSGSVAQQDAFVTAVTRAAARFGVSLVFEEE